MSLPGCIRVHVVLCWLALLLIRIAETTTATTWAKISDELGLLTLGRFTGPAGHVPADRRAHQDPADLLVLNWNGTTWSWVSLSRRRAAPVAGL